MAKLGNCPSADVPCQFAKPFFIHFTVTAAIRRHRRRHTMPTWISFHIQLFIAFFFLPESSVYVRKFSVFCPRCGVAIARTNLDIAEMGIALPIDVAQKR